MDKTENDRIKNEPSYWRTHLGKIVSVVKKFEGRAKPHYYQGKIVGIFPNKIILEDRKIGNIPLTLDGLSLIDVKKEG